MHTLINKIDGAVVASKGHEGHRKHLGASIIGRPCDRQLWYTFRWAKRPEFEGRMYRLFDRGHKEEDSLSYYLRQAGVTIHTVDKNGEQFRVKDFGGHFGGSMDGAMIGIPGHEGDWMVAEFKTHNDKSFKRLVKEGVCQAKPEHHAQMQVYMHYTGMKKAGYLSVNKNDDHLHFEVIEYNEDFAKALTGKAYTIIFSDTPPERMAGPDYYLCRWCDFRSICHQTELPERNCRTCAHVTPVDDKPCVEGAWICENPLYGNMGDVLSDEEMRKALPCHRYNPHIHNSGAIVAIENGDVRYAMWTDSGPDQGQTEKRPVPEEAPGLPKAPWV